MYVNCAIKIVWFLCKISRLILAVLMLFTVTKEELVFHRGEIQHWSLNLWPLDKLYRGLWVSFSTHTRGGVDLSNMVCAHWKKFVGKKKLQHADVGTPILLQGGRKGTVWFLFGRLAIWR